MDQRFKGVVVFLIAVVTAIVFQYGFQVYFQAPQQPNYEDYVPSNLQSTTGPNGQPSTEYTKRQNDYNQAANLVNQQTQAYDRNRFMAEAVVVLVVFLLGWLIVARRPVLASGLVTGSILGEFFLRGVFNFDGFPANSGPAADPTLDGFIRLSLTNKFVTALVLLLIIALVDWFMVERSGAEKAK